MPYSRPMPGISSRCSELRIRDQNKVWRIMYRTDPDAIVILEIFSKKTPSTPRQVIADCRKRLHQYEQGANR
jgi:phage-related protein